MTIDEAIKHCLETAEQLEERANIPYKVEDSELQDSACRECAADHRQLAEWLTELKHLKKEVKLMKPDLDSKNAELKEAKRLLKLAVEDMNCGSCNASCKYCIHCGSCDYSERFKWIHTDEALKLIGNE